MKQDIYITGTGQTRFGEHWNLSLAGLMEEAIDTCIDASPCTALDVDLIVVANMLGERTNTQAHLGVRASSMLPHQPPALRVESACASGAIALHTACGMLESGKAETVLVVGVEKMTDVPVDEISAGLMGAADAEVDSPVGLTFPGIFGLVANAYMHEHGLTRERLSIVSAKHHENASQNPYAQFRNPITPEAVTASAPVADPIRMLDCSPVTDGAAAVLLSTKHESPLRIAASQLASDHLSLSKRQSLTSFAASQTAMENALEEAEITRDDIAHLEIHDCFSIAAIINLEDLGFAEPGHGVELYESQDVDRSRTRTRTRTRTRPDHSDSTPPTINLSGGLKACGHPVAATGIKQVTDMCKQLQSSQKRYGLTHNFGGACASCGIHIIEQIA